MRFLNLISLSKSWLTCSSRTQICYQNVFRLSSSTPKRRKWNSRTFLISMSSAFVGTSIVVYIAYRKFREREELLKNSTKGKSTGEADVGGSYQMYDHRGELVSNEDFLGKWLLIYFGFCHCPDICPIQIERLCDVTDRVDYTKDVPNVTPIFISVDPKRDTPQMMAEYIKEFSPKLIGLTGTEEETEKITKKYRYFYRIGPKDSDGDYIVDHFIITYLIDPEGNYVEHYGQTNTPQEMHHRIMARMKEYKPSNKGVYEAKLS